MSRFKLIAAALALAACQTAETPEQTHARMNAEAAALRPIIEAKLVSFSRWAAAGHADSIATLYAPNAVVMPPGAPPVVGRDSIRAMLANYGPFNLVVRVVSVTVNGPLAVERGSYTFTFTPPGATAPVAVEGKGLAHWHLVDGEWMVMEDIWSDNVPMPAPPPAPARRN